ncbi:MAG TPA: hypothetical protein EYN67_20870 [Flavobacteriales bacterium]|nr:hypothetical protein [Flavobacteriales bacterium]
MIISKCPLRVSLCGGSTDSPAFIRRFKRGKVISFTPTLYTYSTLHKDVNGFNNFDKQYLLSYSNFEKCSDISSIRNELIKEVLDFFNVPPLKVTLGADVFSLGSGLASSSSYILNLVSGISTLQGLNLNLNDICRLSFCLESKINPFNGYQDPYGCAFGGFKLIEFHEAEAPHITHLPTDIFNEFNFYLIYTNIQRRSETILKSIDITKSYPLLEEVDALYKYLIESDYINFFKTLNHSWEIKKNISPKIIEGDVLKRLDKALASNKGVLAHKLCGAGGGGYFLAITGKSEEIKLDKNHPYIKIQLETSNLFSQMI